MAFEVDGPMHFLRFHDPARPAPPPPTISEPEAAGDAPVTTLRSSPVIVLGGVMDGLSSFRNRGLGSLGIDVVSVPYYRVPTRGCVTSLKRTLFFVYKTIIEERCDDSCTNFLLPRTYDM